MPNAGVIPGFKYRNVYLAQLSEREIEKAVFLRLQQLGVRVSLIWVVERCT